MKTIERIAFMFVLSFLIMVAAVIQGYSQQGLSVERNVIKVKPLSFEFGYERALNNFLSINTSARFLPIGIKAEGNTGDGGEFSLNNYRIMPEARFYVASRQGAPRGFFMAPYVKAGLTTVKAETTSDTDLTAQVKFNGNSWGAGFTLGWQWITIGGFSIDTQFGWGYNSTSFKDVTVTYSDGTVEKEQAPIDNLKTTLPRFSFSIGYAF
jgi:hypothetical protein